MAKKELSDIPYLVVGSVVALQEEIEKAAERLVDKGKSLTPEGRKKAMEEKKGLVSKGDDFSKVVARTVQRVLENVGLVTRSDLEDVDRRVTVIEKKVATKRKAARKPARKKAAAKKAESGQPTETISAPPAAQAEQPVKETPSP
jgi:polyhydroxyalkanoate synthesis regulator phasin